MFEKKTFIGVCAATVGFADIRNFSSTVAIPTKPEGKRDEKFFRWGQIFTVSSFFPILMIISQLYSI